MSPPPLEPAEYEAVAIILKTCESKQAVVSRKRDRQTERLLNAVWCVSFARLQEAIVEHIERKRKIFNKYGTDGKRLDDCFDANVTLFEELNIYVEMTVRSNTMVILAAHGHSQNPLPQ